MSGEDGSLTDFLNPVDEDSTVKVGDGENSRTLTLVDPSNPLNVLHAMGAVLGSFFGIFAVGFMQFVTAVGAAYRELFGGISDFVTTLFIDWLIDPFTLAVEGSYLISLERFGLGALPVSFAIVLSTLFVLSVITYWLRRRVL